MSAAENKNPREEDKYVLKKSIGFGYYSAIDFSRGYESNPVFRIMRKENEQYTLLPTPGMYIPNYGEPESNLLLAWEGEEGSDSRCIFYCDSSGWNYTRNQFAYYPEDYYIIGKGKAARLYLTYDLEYEQTGNESEYFPDYTARMWGVGSIVDLDSGYIVLDSVKLEEETYYENDYVYVAVFPALKDKYVIYQQTFTGLYGIMDQNGNPILKPRFTSMEKTSNPEIVKVNGKKFIYAATGLKAPKVKEEKPQK
jgi:hypothetical protein